MKPGLSLNSRRIFKLGRKLLGEKRSPRQRDLYYQRKYGISLEEYNELKAQQNHICAICLDDEAMLHVDHCHITGKVRGLICQNCNVGIGMLRDTSAGCLSAYNYLKRFEDTL